MKLPQSSHDSCNGCTCIFQRFYCCNGAFSFAVKTCKNCVLKLLHVSSNLSVVNGNQSVCEVWSVCKCLQDQSPGAVFCCFTFGRCSRPNLSSHSLGGSQTVMKQWTFVQMKSSLFCGEQAVGWRSLSASLYWMFRILSANFSWARWDSHSCLILS